MNDQTSESVTYDVADHIATITLNRPARRNALNWDAYAKLEAAFRRAVSDEDARCVIVTGADPAFCSGDDVGEIMAGRTRLRSARRRQSCGTSPPPRLSPRSNATSR
ncbi:enoyl-CoA hydratase/isomerase family protein [Sphingomonas olei]|uniref:enoyl-CoA hydratase/isomerase family protein n=1 Tax=Sphingomonas olei TaxID=1886787 RepID=UPI001B3B3DA1|nr:enoyl-CoA hydratase/isomerase family protein [Sphingomonas olei]